MRVTIGGKWEKDLLKSITKDLNVTDQHRWNKLATKLSSKLAA